MNATEQEKLIIKQAGEIIKNITEIANTATKELQKPKVNMANVFANSNQANMEKPIGNYVKNEAELFQNLKRLALSPCIARIEVVDNYQQAHTYYICKGTALNGFQNLASYKSDVGRLAALPIGEVLTLPNNRELEVLSKTIINPRQIHKAWDSKDTRFELNEDEVKTVESLINLVSFDTEQESESEINIDDLLLNNTSINITDGIKRNIIEKMGLRDQPVLDQFQDEIFRLPINSKLIILGPPGTGKTTTLIRRLGQKIDEEFLDEEEKSIVDRIDKNHRDNWLMFTPTELLKQYLKEAFAREGIAAPDKNIKTWNDYRKELGRQAFGILRTSDSTGYYVLKEKALTIKQDAIVNSIEWFNCFNDWQAESFFDKLLTNAIELEKFSASKKWAKIFIKILNEREKSSVVSVIFELTGHKKELESFVAENKTQTSQIIKKNLNQLLKKDKDILLKLVDYIDSLKQVTTNENEDTDESFDTLDEEEVVNPKEKLAIGFQAYSRAIKDCSKASVNKIPLKRTSKSYKIVKWLGDNIPNSEDLTLIGSNLNILSGVSGFTNPVKEYVFGIPKRYKNYRKDLKIIKKWFNNKDYDVKDLNPLELDIILLTILRSATALIKRANTKIVEPAWSSLNNVKDRFVLQILVDEATDFSPIQLACMAALTVPDKTSFFACGDFNQRLTTWGAQTQNDLNFVLDNFEIKHIDISYRQSLQLSKLANQIIQISSGSKEEISSKFPKHVEVDAVAPLLLENATQQKTIQWLKKCITYIEKSLKNLPSIAIFVNAENEVDTLAKDLSEALEEANINVIACKNGQVVGQDNDVRVFDIQHIKGLEFEAVFFINVDELSTNTPTLFDKYLYVGATRAATYLGLTCRKTFPSKFKKLKDNFEEKWPD